MKKRKNRQLFSHRQMIWYYIFGAIIVIGSVMSFGLVGSFTFGWSNADWSLSMVFMIAPMGIVMFLGIYYITRRLEKKIGPLLAGIHQVAKGDLDTKLDVKYAAEYTNVYEDFNDMVVELKRTKEEMQGFVNEFTHEFKTPITSISGFADLLYETGDELSKEEREEYLKIIADQASRLSRLSQNSLLLSKVEATQILTDKEKYSLSDQLQKCGILFLKQMEEKKITLELPEDVDIHYVGNQELMEHVWINLLGNALKFTPKNGTITISEVETDQEIRIGIHDTGEGMSEETISHIFEKYYQHDMTNVVKGNGIGLAIVHRIVELSGGKIEVTSELGKGSTFLVILPKNK